MKDGTPVTGSMLKGCVGYTNPSPAPVDSVERLTVWASKHSNVTPLDGTDRDSPTFGDLRALLAALAKDDEPTRYWPFANSGIRCVGKGSTLKEARSYVVFTYDEDEDATVDAVAALLNSKAMRAAQVGGGV